MSFSQYSGTAILPVLARVVLFAAFLPVGAQKIFNEVEFEGQDAGTLIRLGVVEAPMAQAESEFRLASLQDDEGDVPTGSLRDRIPPPDPNEELDLSELKPDVEEALDRAGNGADIDTAAFTGTVSAKSLHHVTVILSKGKWKDEWRPEIMAWIAGLTELLGGTFILVGLFSRLWGLGLAITMGFAFYFTSWPDLVSNGWFSLSDNLAAFNRLYCQLGLMVLAMGIFLTGAGPLSLDRFFFGGKPDVDGDDDDLDPGD